MVYTQVVLGIEKKKLLYRYVMYTFNSSPPWLQQMNELSQAVNENHQGIHPVSWNWHSNSQP